MKVSIDVPDSLDGQVWLAASSSGRLQPHCYEELEFNLVESGTARYLLGSRRYELRKGTLVWLFPNQRHVLLGESDSFSMWVAVFKRPLVNSLCPEGTVADILSQTNPPGDFSRILPASRQAFLKGLLSELESLVDEPGLHRAGLGWLLRIAWRYWREATLETRFKEIHPAVEKAVRLLHADRTLSLPRLAARSGISASRLSRIFKSETGITMSSFRNQCRIQRFIELYGGGKRRTMLDCALDADFGSYEQFHRAFKRQMGCSPREYFRSGNACSVIP